LRATKKNGHWSAEERKALKKEAKSLMKETKLEIKDTWNIKAQL
jgi:hypothetical protein